MATILHGHLPQQAMQIASRQLIGMSGIMRAWSSETLYMYVPRVNTEWHHISPLHSGGHRIEWNSLHPSELRTLKSSVAFGVKLRTYMFNNYIFLSLFNLLEIFAWFVLCTCRSVVCFVYLQDSMKDQPIG